jgi:RNA polymerase sigma-70 factor (ECF subfamily)
MTDSRSHDCEALLASADWVRALARRLLADAQAAEDLAQDTLAAALVRPPADGRPLRGWLAGVMRNLVRRERRDAGHRGARERAVAREEAQASSAELLERLDSHRAVVEAVARLDEPYRAAILMRYFEGLTPAAIARRTGTPRRTVHTRLQRALARLRAELDRAHGGDRRSWLLALIPYARGSGGWNSVATGTLVMETKLKLGVAALAAVGVCSTIVLWRGEEDALAPVRADEQPRLASQTPRAGEATGVLAETPAEASRRAPDAPTAAAATTDLPAAPPRLLGRVLDVEHLPVAGVRVRYSSPGDHGQPDLETTTDATGAFALDRPERGGTLDVASPGWTSIFRPELSEAPDEHELVLVVARSITLGGTVADERGRALASARLAVPMPFGLRARFDAVLDRSSTVERSTQADAGGRFELAEVPLVPGVELVTTHAGYVTDRRALPAFDELALAIVLRSAREEPAQLLGTVVDPEGAPVEGAWVALGAASARSGAAGAFALDLEEENSLRGQVRDGAPLRAVKAGYLPAELARPRGYAWPEPLILRLGGPPLAISGRVVDADGLPVPSAELWTSGETHFGYIAIEGAEMAMRAGASVEGILRGDPWTWRTRADAAGRFELRGLLPHDYRVCALDKVHLLATEASLPAGLQGIELRLPREELHDLVAGRVTSLSGAPLAGLHVVLERPAAGPALSELDRLDGRAATTDGEGRFRFERVSSAATLVRVSGLELGLMGFERRLGPEDDVERLELAVPLRVHVQVDVGGETAFERIALLDARGEKLALSVQHGQSAFAMQEVRLEAGRTESFSVSELAATLVLYGDGDELRRVPVSLRHGELNTLRP